MLLGCGILKFQWLFFFFLQQYLGFDIGSGCSLSRTRTPNVGASGIICTRRRSIYKGHAGGSERPTLEQ